MKLTSVFLLIVLATSSYAEDYKYLSQQYNLTYQAFLVKKILKLPKHCGIRISFKHGEDQFFRYEGYSKYDDAVWVSPAIPQHGLANVFNRQAFAIQQLQDVQPSEPV